ncbi:MAG: RagB/SusD family nutrient uptake outer membrane protein [Bacteroidales bacterium]
MKIFTKLLTIVCILNVTSSCSNYLDIVPDNTITLEDLFNKKEDAWKALATVYSYMPRIDRLHYSMWLAGDEYIGDARYDYDNRFQAGTRLMMGLQSKNSPILGDWSGTNYGDKLYSGIRQANIFIYNIDNVPDMTDVEKKDWKAQVRFLKAYYHFLLLQKYGPIIISDDIIEPDDTDEELFKRRNKVEECFKYIIGLIDEAIPGLSEKASGTLLGQVDRIVAKSIKARILLFRASPFYNGNSEYFGSFLDSDGEPFFSKSYEKGKWKDALDAVNEAIDISALNGVEMYSYEKQIYAFDRDAFAVNKENLQKIYDLRMLLVDPWNKELIWGYSNIEYQSGSQISHGANMMLPEGYGEGITNSTPYSYQWLCATYRMAERYYTTNGVPIEEDLTFDVANKWQITYVPTESDPEYQKLAGIMQPGAETIQLYLNREPRFYANLAISGGYWRTHMVKIRTQMYQNSDGGYLPSVNRSSFFRTGIGIKKLIHPVSKSGAWERVVNYPYPIIRLADLYLMKAEALNEYYDAPTQEVYDAINMVRRRAGIPDVEDIWADANIVKNVGKHTTKEGMRDIIIDERSVEFAFEGLRFWDMIRTKRAVEEFNSPIFGWTYTGETGEAFFNLEVTQTRRFDISNCLWPIDLSEMNTNSNLIQNPGW